MASFLFDSLFKEDLVLRVNNEKTSVFYNETSLFSKAILNNHTNYQQDENEPRLIFILCVSLVLSLIDLTTFAGNLLVVFSVLTTKSLHTVTNSFIMSLAVADMLVAILVLPLSIYMVIFNKWIFGTLVCDLWIACDILLCTASILNLCCISLDRYFAITRPLTYTRQRSPRLARTMITFVWIVSFLISCPPVFGWKDKNRQEGACSLNLLLSYRIYSSLGSFFLPCIIMIFVYVRIFKVIHDREKYLKMNASCGATKMSIPNKKSKPGNEAKCKRNSQVINENDASENKANNFKEHDTTHQKNIPKITVEPVSLKNNDCVCHLNQSGTLFIENISLFVDASSFSDLNNQENDDAKTNNIHAINQCDISSEKTLDQLPNSFTGISVDKPKDCFETKANSIKINAVNISI